MRTLIVGECRDDSLYRLRDPDAPSETELEYQVVKVLSCVYQHCHCIVFGGGFEYEGKIYRPDLALVAKDFFYWFIIEVELLSHSLEGHVLPQVRAFRYGTPTSECEGILARELKILTESAKTLLDHVPRAVAVIANKRDFEWYTMLRAHNIQYLAVSKFSSSNGVDAVEVDGSLEVLQESLGFGRYIATDRSLRFPRLAKLPIGTIRINDPEGSFSLWTVTRDDHYTWITKETGVPDIPNSSLVQLVRTMGGEISSRRPI